MVDWTEDELVLAADLVSRNGWTGVRAASVEARALSALLRVGGLHDGEVLPANFRSPSSIQRKSYDLATAVADYAGTPTRGGKNDARVIASFRANPSEMQARARAIRVALEAGERFHSPTTDDLGDEAGKWEGGILEHVARRRERDPRLRAKKIDAVVGSGKAISCEVCTFDFHVAYGSRGSGYIEVHHIRPLHYSGPVQTTLNDLALLCSNCHRMCHRGPWITPTQLLELIQSKPGDSAT